jgi:zinc-binding alcohol dehydrogenase/oxidoreductase
MGSPDDFQDMIAFIRQHQLKPVVDKIFPFAEGQKALERMNDAQQFGKIVIRLDA